MTRNAARPRRSVLYMPGANARAWKRRNLDADAVIMDLEDAVAPDAKVAARATVAAALAAGDYGRARWRCASMVGNAVGPRRFGLGGEAAD